MATDNCDVFLSSFIAGVLYENKNIDHIYFCYLLSDFCNVNKIDIGEDDDDDNIINNIVVLDDKCIYLINNYDDIIIVNGNKMTFKDYLYTLTTPNVRKYFNIQERKIIVENYNYIENRKRTKTIA